jgi:hypothetical protein
MLNRAASGKYGKGFQGVLSAYDQFSPISAAIFGKSEDKKAERIYGTYLLQNYQEILLKKNLNMYDKMTAEPDGLNKLQQILGGGSASVAATVLNDPKYLAASRENVKGALEFLWRHQTTIWRHTI